MAVPTPYSEAVGGGVLKARALASSSSLSVFLRGGAPAPAEAGELARLASASASFFFAARIFA